MGNETLTEVGPLHKRSLRLMGNIFSFSIVASNEAFATECLDAAVSEIRRIERLLTTFDGDSQTNRVNASAGLGPVQVDAEVFALIKRSINISNLTQGAFDLTYGSIDKSLWNFDVNMTALPDPSLAKEAVRLINYGNIILDEKECTVFLKHRGMRIGFGGIGKGYAADRARDVLKAQGISGGIVNAAGDLTTWGRQSSGKAWTIGIADPNTKSPFSYLDLTDLSMATSGDYEKFVTIGGKRYSHTISPKTGMPVSGIKSVTIISPIAELSDAMTTPVMVMGVQTGLHMINQMNQIACIIVDDKNQIHTSINISIH